MTRGPSPLAIGIAAPADATASLKSQHDELWEHWYGEGSHPWNWISGKDTDGRPLIWTKDERDPAAPVKPYPADKEYLRELVEVLHNEKRVLIDKARQMMVTITVMLYVDWYCARHQNRLVLVSKVKEKAASKILKDKIRDMIVNLPEWVKQRRPASKKPQNLIHYAATNSDIMAVAENFATGDSRGNTASIVVVDEAAFQSTFREIVSASGPMTYKLFAFTTPQAGGMGARAFKELLDEGQERDQWGDDELEGED